MVFECGHVQNNKRPITSIAKSNGGDPGPMN